MRTRLVGTLLLTPLLAAVPAVAQVTEAERSDFARTSTYADVLQFLDSLQVLTNDLRVAELATSSEGRAVPWVLAARPMIDGPAAAHRSGKPVVYLQGNIHAGEVEGKEAAQMLLRDLTVGSLAPLLDSLILLVVPIYNVDGNERFGPGVEHRPGQNGPDRVGLRPNGQGLDLNRDYVKMEAPETRGAARLINHWDPDIFIDLHTTNGSYHGYTLTYAPGLNPNSSPANRFVRDELLPSVRQRVRERHGQETFWYGNFRNQNPDSLDQGWYTYDPRPRFGTNWFGMRGRMAILAEGYSNASFRVRVEATYVFVQEVLRYLATHAERIAELQQQGSAWRPDTVALRTTFAAPTVQDVIAEITTAAGDGTGPFARRVRSGTFRSIPMPVYDRFTSVLTEDIPSGYLLPARLREAVALLQRHGVHVEQVRSPWTGAGQVFSIDSLIAARRAFQGHRTVRLEGRWVARELDVDSGWYYVSTDQRLGTLATYLLEPASADGLVTWNVLDGELARGRDYPIIRVLRSPDVPTTLVPSLSP